LSLPYRNVLGDPLETYSTDPITDFQQDDPLSYDERHPDHHESCAVMTDKFLAFGAERGNDLTTPRPRLDFPGLKSGDRWCVCVPWWVEILEAVRDRRVPATTVPPVVLEATNDAVLDTVSLEKLKQHAFD
jgi:uncharacterized protein (DUF2237 family)